MSPATRSKIWSVVWGICVVGAAVWLARAAHNAETNAATAVAEINDLLQRNQLRRVDSYAGIRTVQIANQEQGVLWRHEPGKYYLEESVKFPRGPFRAGSTPDVRSSLSTFRFEHLSAPISSLWVQASVIEGSVTNEGFKIRYTVSEDLVSSSPNDASIEVSWTAIGEPPLRSPDVPGRDGRAAPER